MTVTRIVLITVITAMAAALATVALCIGVLYGAYGSMLSPAGAAKLSAVVDSVVVSNGSISELVIGQPHTNHHLLLGTGTDSGNFTGAWIRFGVHDRPGLMFESHRVNGKAESAMYVATHVVLPKEHLLDQTAVSERVAYLGESSCDDYLGIPTECRVTAPTRLNAVLYSYMWPATSYVIPADCEAVLITMGYTYDYTGMSHSGGYSTCQPPCGAWYPQSIDSGVELIVDGIQHSTHRPVTTRVLTGNRSVGIWTFRVVVMPLHGDTSSGPIVRAGETMRIGPFMPPLVAAWAASRPCA